MRNRALHVLSLVSAVVCMLSLSVVGRSFFWADELHIRASTFSYYFVTIDGRLWVEQATKPRLDTFTYRSVPATDVRRDYERLYDMLEGIPWLGIRGGIMIWMVLVLPLWLVPVVSGVLPVRWWVVWRRRGGRGFAVEVGDGPHPSPPPEYRERG